MNACQNNPTKSYTEKKAEHEPSCYSLVTYCSFDQSKNEIKYYRGEDCMKMFCKDLKDRPRKIIDYEKKEMIPLTDKEKETHENQRICCIYEQEFCTNKNKKEFKKKQKVRDHDHYAEKYRGTAHSICNLRYKVPKEIPVVFQNGSTYDYHFIIKKLAKEFKGNFDCLGENTEKYITFSVPIKKELKNGKVIICKIKFIDSYRFMSISLSSLTDNLEEINNTKKPEDEFISNMRSMTDLLSTHINTLSEINKKVHKNKFIDNMRSMSALLSSHINDL